MNNGRPGTHRWSGRTVTNADIADLLDRVADLLDVQGANPFRVRAYRSAAGTVRHLGSSVADLLSEEGVAGLRMLPGIGEVLAHTIQEFVATRRLVLLDRLEGQVCPEDLLRTVPGIGPELARRIHVELGIETLEDLELAAHDGRLEGVAGFGHRRVQGLRDTLAGMLGRSARRRALRFGAPEAAGSHEPSREWTDPPVETLLSVDEEYRRGAEAGTLHRIAPRRFNPSGERWLPILHTERQGWAMTALFSNTARAHELGRTHDWVVIYAEGSDGREGRFTVVTEYQGDLAGQRVVRGREAECRSHYLRSTGVGAV
jgi:hypothetical protein